MIQVIQVTFCIFFQKLKHIPGQLIAIPAKDQIPKNSKISDIREAQNRKKSETGGLALLLELKVNARVMLTANIKIEDRLINRQMETVKHIEIKENEVRTIYLELDDNKLDKSELVEVM